MPKAPVLVLDASGLRALVDLKKQCSRKKVTLILEGVHAQPLIALERAQFLPIFGEDNVVGSLDEALERARKIIEM